MGSDSKRGITGINVTPLIDVLLVLLTIFMVIVPVTSHGLTSSIPQPPKQGEPHSDDAVVLQVIASASGQFTYLLNQTPLAKSDIRGRLASIFESRQQKVVFVKADPSMEYARVAEMIDLAHEAQVDTVALMTSRTAGDH